ncbi:MAG TPA: hypothetical protein VGF67_26560 [Ktedonobacteraceae bacterium]
MVLWTRRRYSRFLQALAVFLLLFLGICALLLLVMASGIRWPGLAVTAVPSVVSQVPGVPATLTPAMVPVIVQNPAPQVPTLPQHSVRHLEHHRSPVARPTPLLTPPATPAPTPTSVLFPAPIDQELFP